MKTGEHSRWNWIWALLPAVQLSLVVVLLFMNCHISPLFWGSVGYVFPTHSITCTRNPELESIGGVFWGAGVWVCVNTHTSFAIFCQHCCWYAAAHVALQKFEHTGRILNSCYPTCLIRFNVHAMEFESSLWKGILIHLQHGLKSNTFVQVWVPTVFLAAIRIKWTCFGRLVYCHIPQCSLKLLKAQSLKTEE